MKPNFHIVEENYNGAKSRALFNQFKQDYLNCLDVSVKELKKKYGLNNYQIGRFVKRIIEDEGVKRRGGGGQKSRLEQVTFTRSFHLFGFYYTLFLVTLQ